MTFLSGPQAIPACSLDVVGLELREYGGVLEEHLSETVTHVLFDKRSVYYAQSYTSSWSVSPTFFPFPETYTESSDLAVKHNLWKQYKYQEIKLALNVI